MEAVKSFFDELIEALDKYESTENPTYEQKVTGFVSFPDRKFYPKQEFAIEHCNTFKLGGHDGG